MPRHHNRSATLLPGLAFAALFGLVAQALAEDATKVRPGFGYTIDFMSAANAEALLPLPSGREIVVVRPGFGDTIDFMSGPAAEALLPLDWATQKGATRPPQS